MDDTLSPKVAALRAYIERALEEIPPSVAKAATEDRVLFLGAWQSTLPRLILHDPLLGSDAKVLWTIIKDYSDPRVIGAMPDHSLLCRKIRKASRNTLAVALFELRIMRLLSLYQRPRTQLGRFSGNLYLLHDEPLTLADALHLDPDYLSFLRQMRTHNNKGIRQLADAVLVNLDRQIDQDRDVLDSSMLEHLAVRHEAYRTLETPPSPAAWEDNPFYDNPFFPGGQAGFEAESAPREDRAQNLSMVDSYKEPGSLYENHRAQILSMDQNLNRAQILSTVERGSGSGSSNNINKKNNITTTTPTPPPPSASGKTQAAPSEAIPELVWPSALSQAEREVCRTLLDATPPRWWQPMLDELEARICRKDDPLRNRLRWLKAVCDEVRRDGLFMPSERGESVRAEREKTIAKPVVAPTKPIDREAATTVIARLREVIR